MPDGFTENDRLNLNNVCRDMVWLKELTEKKMDEAEDRRSSGERRLHERIDATNIRINKVWRYLLSASGALSLAGGAVWLWVKAKLTGGG